MNCERCGHPYTHHLIGNARKCRMRIAYDWNEKAKTFEKTAPCLCPGYKGVRPGGSECPHEYVKESDNCVHCGHAMVAGEKEIT